MPDILARSDWINEITVEPSIDKKSEKEKAPILRGDYHYIVMELQIT